MNEEGIYAVKRAARLLNDVYFNVCKLTDYELSETAKNMGLDMDWNHYLNPRYRFIDAIYKNLPRHSEFGVKE